MEQGAESLRTPRKVDTGPEGVIYGGAMPLNDLEQEAVDLAKKEGEGELRGWENLRASGRADAIQFLSQLQVGVKENGDAKYYYDLELYEKIPFIEQIIKERDEKMKVLDPNCDEFIELNQDRFMFEQLAILNENDKLTLAMQEMARKATIN